MESHFNQPEGWSGIHAHLKSNGPQGVLNSTGLLVSKKARKAYYLHDSVQVSSQNNFLLLGFKLQQYKHERKTLNGGTGVETEGI